MLTLLACASAVVILSLIRGAFRKHTDRLVASTLLNAFMYTVPHKSVTVDYLNSKKRYLIRYISLKQRCDSDSDSGSVSDNSA